MFSKICTFLILSFVAAFALSAMADNGYPHAILLRQAIKDHTGFDLAVLTDTTKGDPQINWRQRIKDKMNEWKAAQSNVSPAAGMASTTGRSAGSIEQTNDTGGGTTPSATQRRIQSSPAFDWSLEEEDNPVKGTRTRYAEGIARLSDGTLIEGRAQVSHTYYGGNKKDLEYGQDFKVDFMLTAFDRGGQPKDFISEKNDDGVALISSEIKTGNNPPHTNGTFERFSNQITISFYDLDKFDKLIGYNPSVKRRVEGGTGAQQLVAGLFGAVGQLVTNVMHENAAEYSGGTLDQLVKSDAVIVELAFADGSKGYVDLTPQNENLVALAAPLVKLASANAGNDRSLSGGTLVKPDWCPKAVTNVEVLICNTPKLAIADTRITAIYTALKNSPNPPTLLGKGMTAFLTQRNACQSFNAVPDKIDCIDGVYAKWIAVLQSH